MISTSILNSIKDYLEALPILTSVSNDPWVVQITSEEKPFPISGQSVITLYPVRIVRESLKDQQFKFIPEVELCLTKRIKIAPRDNQENPLYSSIPNSLVSLTEILWLLLDSNNFLTNLINNNIISNKSSVVSLLESSTESSSLTVAAAIDTLQTLEVTKVVELITKPIPRDDRFFSAFNTKREVLPQFTNDSINPAGYSTKIRLKCPAVMMKIPC